MNKIPEFYMNFARKMPEFYIIIARKYFPRILGGHMPPPLLPRLLRLCFYMALFVKLQNLTILRIQPNLNISEKWSRLGWLASSQTQQRRNDFNKI